MSMMCKRLQNQFHWCLRLMAAAVITGIGTMFIPSLAIAFDGSDGDVRRLGILDCRQFHSDSDRGVCLRLRATIPLYRSARRVLDEIDDISGRPPLTSRSAGECLETAGNDCAFNQLGVIESVSWDGRTGTCTWTCESILRAP